MTDNIIEIEDELNELLTSNKKLWVRTYELMNEVDELGLWKGRAKSYTAWVRQLATKTKVNESLLWRRKKAGKIFSQYQERQAERGNTDIKTLEEVDISPENLQLTERIAQGNEDYQDELIEKVLNDELGRKDLNNLWRTVKAERGQSAVRKSRHYSYDDIKQEEAEATEQTEQTEQTEKKQDKDILKAVDIVRALSTRKWLEDNFDKREYNKRDKYTKEVNRDFTEFAVYSGSSRTSRRIDFLKIENYTENIHEIMLHGIEIKVSKSDLERDEKVSEYYDFVDYLYFAVPENLKDIAVELAPKEWGVLSINDNLDVEVVQKPVRNKNNIYKIQALNTLLLEVL